MQLTWYGTASLLLREGDTAIAFDPFCGMPIRRLPGKDTVLPYTDKFREAGSVFVTHGHLDHIYHIPRLYHDCNTTIFCTRTPYRTLSRRGVSIDSLCEISPGWRKDIGPFHITAYQGRHCRNDLPLIMKKIFSFRTWRHLPRLLRLAGLHTCYPENGEILFYEILCQGKRIQIMGSMNLDDDTSYPTGADVLVLPLQGRNDQDEYALQFVERLKPKQVLLDHYDDAFCPLTDDIDTSGFVKNVQERFGISCRPLRKGETIYE